MGISPSGADSIVGGEGNDTLYGEANDTIQGFNDTIRGEAGDDKIYGYGGDDSLSGGDGVDYIDGGDGNDILDGGTGSSTLLGGAGLETIRGGIEGDYIDGGEGNDNLSGLGGNDTIYGDVGVAVSLAGNDILNGGVGDDFLDGGAGVDRIIGGAGFDVLFGGEDAETQTARDTLTGGADTDYFQLLYTAFVPEPPVIGEPIVSPPVGDYIVDFVKGTDLFLVEGITFEQLGFQNISLTVGGVATPSTRIYVKPEAGIPIAQAETLAVVQGVRQFNASHFIFGGI
ncbi:MAG: calcium-binding protein [Oscillatoriales cyanobacterium RU_3_3]|nr:calcium-binding protein [Oscillatoriales cyanobacterium RU_3_3]